jgi:hypothetical protein
MDSKQELTAKEILLLEEKIVDPGIKKNPSVLGQIIADDFLEFGSSGKTFTKPEVIKALADQPFAKTEISDFGIKYLAENVLLATYIAARISNNNKTFSLRSSIWMFKEGRWQIVFHQGTKSE